MSTRLSGIFLNKLGEDLHYHLAARAPVTIEGESLTKMVHIVPSGAQRHPTRQDIRV